MPAKCFVTVSSKPMAGAEWQIIWYCLISVSCSAYFSLLLMRKKSDEHGRWYFSIIALKKALYLLCYHALLLFCHAFCARTLHKRDNLKMDSWGQTNTDNGSSLCVWRNLLYYARTFCTLRFRLSLCANGYGWSLLLHIPLHLLRALLLHAYEQQPLQMSGTAHFLLLSLFDAKRMMISDIS